MKKIILSALIAFCSLSAFSQVGIGTTNVDNSAILELKSSTKGMLFPRLTNNEMNAIATPADGLTIYNKEEKCLFIYKENNAAWTNLCLDTADSNENLPLSNERQKKIKTEDNLINSYVGHAVSMSADGTRFVVGSRSNGHNNNFAYIFSYSEGVWKQDKKLVSTNTYTNSSYFGDSVAMSADGNTVLVSSIREYEGGIRFSGGVYVYTYDGSDWVFSERVACPTPADTESFGGSISINSDGTKFVTNGQNGNYLMKKGSTGWTLEHKFPGTTYNGGITLGLAGISADGLTVATVLKKSYPYGSGANDYYPGVVRVYSDDGTGNWTTVDDLESPNRRKHDAFGLRGSKLSLSADGSKIAIYDGQVYVFAKVTTPLATNYVVETNIDLTTGLTSLSGDINEAFGYDYQISADGLKVIVGDYYESSDLYGTPNSYARRYGAAYVFSFSGGYWGTPLKLKAYDGRTNQYFGRGVSLNADGSKAVVGAENDDSDANGRGSLDNYSGAAYVF